MKTIKQLMKETNGLETEAELQMIFDTVSSLKPLVSVEIGCLFGLSSSVIASAMQGNGRLICIDNFMVQGSDTRPYFIQKTMPKYPIIELMDMDSLKASYEFSEPIDFLFIDGDHQDDGIQRDLKSWLPKLSSKGIVAFHDYYNDQFPSIGRRVDEYTQGFKFVGKADSLIIKKV